MDLVKLVNFHKDYLSILTEEEKELYEERAAIKEYEANIPRKEAERQAYEEILLRRNYETRS